MMTITPTKKASRQPLYHAFCVIEGGRGQRDYWTRIGAAFTHENSDGLSILLDALPINGKIVLRTPLPPKAETETAEESADLGA